MAEVNLKGIKLKKLTAPAERPKEEMKKMEAGPSYWDERPTFRVEDKDLPEIKGWDTGNEYTIVMKVKMEEKMSRDREGKSKTCGDFRIISIGAAK